MSEVIIEKCIIETVEETVYFNISYNEVEYCYLTLELSENGFIWLKTPYFFCPCLDGMVYFYTITNVELKDEIRNVVWEYAKNYTTILDILKKKSRYKGEEFKLL